MEAETESGILALPAPSSSGSEEGRLLIREARDYIAEVPEPKQGEPRAESKRRIRKYTAERLFREEPRRYRLIASMRSGLEYVKRSVQPIVTLARWLLLIVARHNLSLHRKQSSSEPWAVLPG